MSNIKNAIENLQKATEIVENEANTKEQEQGFLNKFLKNMQAEGNVHTFWDKVYQECGYSFKVHCPEENKQIIIAGEPAPKAWQTYKSQSVNAYRRVKAEKFSQFTSWSDMKKKTAKPKTEEQLRVEEVYKELKAQIKSGNLEMLELIEAHMFPKS
tara:strand:- start:380 stop:847 length:468 start_codon:yes stop_codon:yes gene_type:complete